MTAGVFDDSKRWAAIQQEQERVWEHACRNCGACCGLMDGDPCEQLVILEDGRSFCRDYTNRFGLHQTRSGKEFCCVPIREIIHESWPGHSGCAYKKGK